MNHQAPIDALQCNKCDEINHKRSRNYDVLQLIAAGHAMKNPGHRVDIVPVENLGA